MEKRSMTKSQELAELTKRYDELIKNGATYDEARVVGIRMSALQLEVNREREAHQKSSDYMRGFFEGRKRGYEQAIKDCAPIQYAEEEEKIIME